MGYKKKVKLLKWVKWWKDLDTFSRNVLWEKFYDNRKLESDPSIKEYIFYIYQKSHSIL